MLQVHDGFAARLGTGVSLVPARSNGEAESSVRRKEPSRTILTAEAVIVGNAAGHIPAKHGEHEFTAPFTRDFVSVRGERRRIQTQRFADTS